ncbi:MAG: cyclohydrolase FolE [Actinomycetota bacterium]
MSTDKTIDAEITYTAERNVDHARAERAVRELLEAIGEDPDPSRDGLLETPGRVARMWAEVLSGTNNDPDHHLSKTFDIEHDEMVLVRDIPFTSVCEHHMLPFNGTAHIAYLPGSTGRFTGLSKLARLVEGYSRRLQVQERLTSQVADAMQSMLEPVGVLVVIEAEHSCMSIRGVRKPGTKTVTTAARGIYRTDSSARAEVMAFIQGR